MPENTSRAIATLVSYGQPSAHQVMSGSMVANIIRLAPEFELEGPVQADRIGAVPVADNPARAARLGAAWEQDEEDRGEGGESQGEKGHVGC